jgi:hypothetical protein
MLSAGFLIIPLLFLLSCTTREPATEYSLLNTNHLEYWSGRIYSIDT